MAIQRALRGERRGFSFNEVLFTVLIIGILTAIAVPIFRRTRQSAEAAACLSNIRAIANAESNYHLENGSYAATANSSLLVGQGLPEFPACPSGGSTGVYTLDTTAVTGQCRVSCGNHSANTFTCK